MKKITLFFLVLLNTLFAADGFKVNFAPLPMEKTLPDLENLLPVSLESKISIKINYIYKKEYEFVEPIITFKKSDGQSKYRCVLANGLREVDSRHYDGMLIDFAPYIKKIKNEN